MAPDHGPEGRARAEWPEYVQGAEKLRGRGQGAELLPVLVSAAWRIWKQLFSHVGAKCCGGSPNKCGDPRSTCSPIVDGVCACSVPGTLPSIKESLVIQTRDPRPEGACPGPCGHLRPGPLTPHTGPQPI